jgi:dUTP pyrophosphatase
MKKHRALITPADFITEEFYNMYLQIKKLDDNADVPERKTSGAAGMDLTACISSPLTIGPGSREAVKTGIAMAVPEHFACFIYARSGLAVKHGITLSNCVGVIDSDYRGEITVGLINESSEPYVIQPHERIAQAVISPVEAPVINVVDELPPTARGDGGFGSTGKI